jgi:hypothetical protein
MNLLILFGETNTAYYENHVKSIKTPAGRNVKVLNVIASSVHIVAPFALKLYA